MADQIDRLAGLDPQSPLIAIRRERLEFVNGIEECRAAVLTPADDLAIAPEIRAALAARMARLVGNEALAEVYDHRIGDDSSALRAVAQGDDIDDASNAFLCALVTHADLVTLAPGEAGAGDLNRLSESGVSEPQMVALSELIAFVNFETRVIAGLSKLVERK